MKRIIMLVIFISLFIQIIKAEVVFDTINVEVMPRYEVGLEFPLMLNFTSGVYKAENLNNICCNDMDFSNTTLSMNYGIFGRINMGNLDSFLFWDKIGYAFSGELLSSGITLEGSNYEPPRKVIFENKLMDLIEQNNLSIDLNYINIGLNFELLSSFDSLMYYDNVRKEPYYKFGIGPSFYFQTSEEISQSLTIVSPSGFTYNNSDNTKELQLDEFEGLNTFLFAVNTNFEVFWYGNQIFNKEYLRDLKVGIDLRFQLTLNSIMSNSDINHFNYGIALKLSYLFPKYYQMLVTRN